MTWAWSSVRTLGLLPGGGACVWDLGGAGAWSDAWAVALAWLGTHLVCPGWCLGWLASAKPPGHGHTNVLEEFVFEASRAATAHEISNSSVRKFQKGFVLEAPRGHAATRISHFSVRECREDSFLRSAEGSGHLRFSTVLQESDETDSS